jgi:hypothetical protein
MLSIRFGYKLKDMIYKIEFENGQIDWCTAKDIVHLLKSYDDEIGLSIQELKEIEEIPEEASKSIMVNNIEYDEDYPEEMPETISLWGLATGNDFVIIASTEF